MAIIYPKPLRLMGHGGGGASCSMFTKDTYSNTHQDGGGEEEVQARGAMDMERGRSHIRNHSHMITYEVGPTNAITVT